MKIGIDARFYGDAGPGRYAKNIVRYLEQIDIKNEYVIFLKKSGFELYIPKNPRFTKVLAEHNWYSFDEQFRFLFKILKQKLDLFYVPHFNIPVLYPGRLITAIPDLIMHTFSTESATTLPLLYFKFKKLIYKLVMLWAVCRSEKIIVPSKDVINDFCKVFPYIKRFKYVLAYEGVDPDTVSIKPGNEDFLRRYDIRPPFLLYVSSMYPHKNVMRLIEAFKVLREKFGFKGQLVLVGKKDTYSQKVFEFIHTCDLEKYIVLPGVKEYVSDEKAAILRKNACVYVFPSLKEGFSLTALEGMALGLPAVISDIPCHREVYGDSVVYFNPHDVQDMAFKINKVICNEELRKSLIVKGYEKVKEYSWENTAEITLKVFEKLFAP